MFIFILHLHFPGDVAQATNDLNTEFDENEHFQEIAEYNIGIRKVPPLFLILKIIQHEMNLIIV